MIKKLIFVFCLLFIPAAILIADHSIAPKHHGVVSHSGGTDKCGCHYNRKTGEYNCHNRKQRGGDCPP